MSITNIDKNHLNNLIEVANLNDLQKDKILKSVQRNSNNYAKIKIIMKQMQLLKDEIENIVNETLETTELENIKCNFKKIPGKTYYLYENKDFQLFFSILSPNEWTSYNKYINSYYYDFDHNLIKIFL